jgi:hypothetical protein
MRWHPLRACAEPVFCGRILMFLAYVFPISERSGVNSSGALNTNPTPFEADAGATPVEDADVDTDAASVPTDYGLYRTFWGVQEYLASPQKILSSAGAWTAFVTSVNTIAAAFDGQGVAVEGDVEEGEEAGDTPAVAGTAAPSPIGDEANDFGTQPGDTETNAGAIEEFYCTKYLTNPQLFNLQVLFTSPCVLSLSSVWIPLVWLICCAAVTATGPHAAPPRPSPIPHCVPVASQRKEGAVWARGPQYHSRDGDRTGEFEDSSVGVFSSNSA